MTIEQPVSEFFTAGGTLPSDAPSYVKRPTDDVLFQRIIGGEFCYVLTPRQMGKSSLMVRTAQRLQREGVRSAIVDLTVTGTVESEDQWYKGILTQIKRRLRINIDPVNWWEQRKDIPNIQNFVEFFEEVLEEIKEHIVIFIDEIDTTLKLDFRDDFFAGIRAIYNARAENPDLKRLTFVLLGVASPSDLIKDRNRTPFNIGQEIPLRPFSRADARMLETGLDEAYPGLGKKILDRVFYWTNGHPYLMQKICQSIVENQLNEYDDYKIDELVERLFISQEASRETNLQFVRDNVLSYPERKVILSLYKKLLRDVEVRDNKNSLPQNHLKLSGLARAENGRLIISNKIYSKVFDQRWVSRYTEVDWRFLIIGALSLIIIGFASLFYNDGVRLPNLAATRVNGIPIFKDDRGIQYLADLFTMNPFIFPDEYEYRAKDTFFNTFGSWEDQRALIEIGYGEPTPSPENYKVVINGLYTSLADVDNSGQTTKLLDVMYKSLHEMGMQNETICQEIGYWLEARKSASENNFQDALDNYNNAINLNPQNPATLFERARIYTQLLEYEQASDDYEAVVIISLESTSVPTSTPVPTRTLPPTETSISKPTLALTSKPTLTPAFGRTQTPSIMPTFTPSTQLSATTTLSATLTTQATLATSPSFTPIFTSTTTPEPVRSRFSNRDQQFAAVRSEIIQHTKLLLFLLENPEKYPNLVDNGMVPTLTPTPINTQTSVSTVLPSTKTPTIASTIVPSPVSQPQPTATVSNPLIGKGKIIFHSDRDFIGQIYIIGQDSANEQRLTSLTDQTWNWYPTWSPDGKTIAFTADIGGNNEIYIMDLTNNDITNLTNNFADDRGPAWSPDGKKIAFRSERGGNPEIYVMNVDGTDLTRLTDNNCTDDVPSWSPDSVTIAFSSDCTGYFQINLLYLDENKSPMQITNGNYDNLHPAWSPDGQKIAFFAGFEGAYDLYLMNTDGSGVTNITKDALNNQHPTWSPDGQKIAFQSDRSGNFDIYVINIDGSDIQQITTHPDYDGEPAWSLNETSKSAPLLYDDFSDAAYNGTYNTALWSKAGNNSLDVYQENNALTFSSTEATSGGEFVLLMRQPAIRSLEHIQFFEARLRVDEQENGFSFVKIQIMAENINGYTWDTECGLGFSGVSGLVCEVIDFYPDVTAEVEYRSTEVETKPNTWYTVRIEMDPATATIIYYLDGAQIGTFTPKDANTLISAKNFIPRIGVWDGDTETVFKYKITDVKITP